MRLRALLGGFLFITAVGLGHRSFLLRTPASEADDRGCQATNAFSFCAAIARFSAALRDPILYANRVSILPPTETPRGVDPAVTQANIDMTICRPGYARTARPSYAVTGPLKRRLMAAQHPGEFFADYELDHLIPISLGGAPFDLRDLWLQPRRGQANAADKNALAYVMWRLVCERRLPLRTAQQAIRRDWTKAYDTYATPGNVARYHFRHGQAEGD